MFEVLTCIRDEHNPVLVILAITIWIIGGTSLFFLIQRALESNRHRQRQWVIMAAITSGIAVWATHFIAMLAYDGTHHIAFEPFLTTLSIVIAVIFFALALFTYVGKPSIIRALLAGLILSTGIAAMHFTGMSAMKVQADVSYRWGLIAGGQLVSILCAATAFCAFDRIKNMSRIPLAVLLSAGAVAAMHFTAMTATVLSPNPLLPFVDAAGSREMLIISVGAATTALVLITCGLSFVDRYFNDMQGFAEASTDGIVILRNSRILSINNRFTNWIGLPREDILNAKIDSFISLQGVDVLNFTTTREGVLYRHNGTEMPVELTANTVEYRGRECRVLSIRDLTISKESQRRIAYLAQHDPLTGLPNRHSFTEELNRALLEADKKGESVALLALDLDRFKAVNDTFGHREGDKVLQEIANFLRSAVRSSDFIARLGGDEFVLIQTRSKQPVGAAALAERIIGAVSRDRLEDKKLRTVGTSIGIAIYPDDAKDADSLRHAADLALYRAKEEGRGTVRFYDDEIDSQEAYMRSLEHDLGKALADDQFWIAYQPLVDARSREIIGYEALLRWNHPTLGAISPEIFITLAEENGYIDALGQWVLHRACREAANWPKQYRLAVNVSAVQFFTPGFLEIVQSALTHSGLEPERLELETTESVVMRNHREVAELLHQLRALGISIVMDDFGTGFSSLSNLQSLPFDKIKIDRSFVSMMEHDHSARAIMRAIIGLGHSLALPIVAEGVETESQMALVTEEGCTQVQGYLFGRPSAEPAHHKINLKKEA